MSTSIRKTNWVRVSLALIMALLVAACAQPAKKEAMIPSSVTALGLNEAFRGALGTVSVTGGKKTNPLWVSNISNEDFAASLRESLRAQGYFAQRGPDGVQVILLSVEQPLLGADFTVTMSARYTITDAAGTTKFDQTIKAPYTAKFGDSLIGVQRLRLANEGAARENIKKFMEALAQS